MQTFRILIVEKETTIASRLAIHLRKWGYQITAVTPNTRQAERSYLSDRPDLVLIDLPEHQPEENIALARFIRRQKKSCPFIFLSSRPDREQIELIKETLPAGFVNKPIHLPLLQASVVLALHKHNQSSAEEVAGPALTLTQRENKEVLPLKQILYLEADHVYVQVHTAEGKRILQRRSLTDLLEQLPAKDFLQTHRSFAVNVKQLSRWDNKYVYLGDQAIPLSRSRRKEVLAFLGTLEGRC